VVYCYFQYDNRPNQTAAKVIKHLFKHFLASLPEIPPEVEEFCNNHRRRLDSPPLPEIIALFVACAVKIPSVYVIMDALDECDETQRKDIIDFIVALTGNRIKVLTTSRPHFPYLRNKFPDIPVQEVRTDDDDLRLYIHQTLFEQLLSDDFKNQIGEVIVKKAGNLCL